MVLRETSSFRQFLVLYHLVRTLLCYCFGYYPKFYDPMRYFRIFHWLYMSENFLHIPQSIVYIVFDIFPRNVRGNDFVKQVKCMVSHHPPLHKNVPIVPVCYQGFIFVWWYKLPQNKSHDDCSIREWYEKFFGGNIALRTYIVWYIVGIQVFVSC